MMKAESSRLLNWLARSNWRAVTLAGLLGAANIFCFEPFALWFLQPVLMATLFLLLRSAASTGQAVLAGWIYGSCSIGVIMYWLVTAMSVYGGMAWPLAVAALILLALFLGAYTAGFAWAVRRLAGGASAFVGLVLLMPAGWLWSEWLRGWIFTGFPWDIAGYAHTVSPLAGYAALIGVYGLSWLAAMLAGALAWVVIQLMSGGQRRSTAGLAGLAGVALIALLLGGGWQLQQLRWTAASGKPIQVRLLQGNVEQDVKFNPDHLQDSLNLYYRMITSRPADLIVTPETALPMLAQALPPDYLPAVQQFASRTGSTVLLGVAEQDAPGVYTNSMLGFSERYATNPYRYDKAHLLPFGEFIPYGFRWFVNLMAIPIGDFKDGSPRQAPLQVGDQYVMPDICYESLFGEEIAAQLRHQYQQQQPMASILLNASNLAWYGDSAAMPQHLQFSVMRVLETGRPWVAATNTGATVVLGADGRVQAQAPYLRQFSLEASVQGTSGLTPYIRFGNFPVIAASLLVCLLGLVLKRRPG